MSCASVAQLNGRAGEAEATPPGKWTLTEKSVPRTSADVVKSGEGGRRRLPHQTSRILEGQRRPSGSTAWTGGAFFLLRACGDQDDNN